MNKLRNFFAALRANGVSPAEHHEYIRAARRLSAAMPPSRVWSKLVLQGTEIIGCDGRYQIGCVLETWKNDIYEVRARKFDSSWPLGEGKWAEVGIFSHDGSARHDWRDFQCIKNDVCGQTWEAIELYPSERRLLDPSNFYIIWCAPEIHIGMNDGRSIRQRTSLAPQRPFPKNGAPADVDVQGDPLTHE